MILIFSPRIFPHPRWGVFSTGRLRSRLAPGHAGERYAPASTFLGGAS